jgi:hypothetical protein
MPQLRRDRPLGFYTEVLGFGIEEDVPSRENRRLTVVSLEESDGVELLEPSVHAAVKPFEQALVEDGIPSASVGVEAVGVDSARLEGLGVRVAQPPNAFGEVAAAVFGDTCGTRKRRARA